MRIEFVAGQVNTEIVLFENLDSETEVQKDRIFTSNKGFNLTEWLLDRPATVEPLFYSLESVLPPPVIAGDWAAHHPYWAEREAKKKRRKENGNESRDTSL